MDAGTDLARELGDGSAESRVALPSYDRSSEVRARLAQGAPLALYKPVSALALAAAVRWLAPPDASAHAGNRSPGPEESTGRRARPPAGRRAMRGR